MVSSIDVTCNINLLEVGSFQVTCHACPAKGSRQARAGSVFFEATPRLESKKIVPR
jgi:hypothetical protein